MEEIRKIVLRILEDMHPDIDFDGYDAMIDGKVLYSFDVISLVADLNDEFDITITADQLVPENFNTVDAICAMIQKLMDED